MFFFNPQQQTDPDTKHLVYSDAFTVLDKVGFEPQTFKFIWRSKKQWDLFRLIRKVVENTKKTNVNVNVVFNI